MRLHTRVEHRRRIAREIPFTLGHAHASMLERYVNQKLEEKRVALQRLAETRENRLGEEGQQQKRRSNALDGGPLASKEWPEHGVIA